MKWFRRFSHQGRPVRREQKEDKTPATKNDPKSVWEAQPPFLCPRPLKWTPAWVPLGLLPMWMGSQSVRKVSSQPREKAIKFPPDSGQGRLEKRERSWNLVLGGQVYPTCSMVI